VLPELTTCSSNLTIIQQTLNAMFLAVHFTMYVRMVEKEVLILCLCITLQFCYIPDKLRPVKYLCNSFMREIAGCLQNLKNCTQVVACWFCWLHNVPHSFSFTDENKGTSLIVVLPFVLNLWILCSEPYYDTHWVNVSYVNDCLAKSSRHILFLFSNLQNDWHNCLFHIRYYLIINGVCSFIKKPSSYVQMSIVLIS